MAYFGRQPTSGNYLLKLDDIQSQFNSSTTTFNLTSGGTAFYPGSAFSLLVSLAGVVQEPEISYTINQNTITFASAPGSGDDFFCIVLGVSLGIGVPGEGTVSGNKLTKPFDYNDGLLYLDSVNNRIGINSTVPTKALDVVGDVRVTGVSTLGTTSATNLTSQSLVVSGISTLGITSATNLTSQSLVVSGISTLGITSTTNLTSQSFVVSGVSTFQNNIIQTSGLVGIGTTNPTSELHVIGDVRVTGVVTATNYFGNGTNLTGISAGLSVSDDISTNQTRYILFDDATAGTISAINVSSTKLTFNPSTGTLSATAFTSLSDVNKKKNIRRITNALDITKKLEGVRFNWKENNLPLLGLIAQEVEKVLPELVTQGEVKSVNYNGIIGVLIEAIKEQQVRIEELERKSNA